MLRWISRQRSPLKNGASGEGKGGRDVKSSRRTPPETKSPTGEKDVTVGTTVGGHLITQPTALNKPSGQPKLAAKGTGSPSVPEQHRGAPLPGHPVTCPGQTAARLLAPLPRAPKWRKTFPHGSGVTKPRCRFPG
jgi:hypothetical protein